MSEYITAKETALHWGVTSTWVTVLCKTGRIINAKKENGKWIIPINTPKPNDSRKNIIRMPNLDLLTCLLG